MCVLKKKKKLNDFIELYPGSLGAKKQPLTKEVIKPFMPGYWDTYLLPKSFLASCLWGFGVAKPNFLTLRDTAGVARKLHTSLTKLRIERAAFCCSEGILYGILQLLHSVYRKLFQNLVRCHILSQQQYATNTFYLIRFQLME